MKLNEIQQNLIKYKKSNEMSHHTLASNDATMNLAEVFVTTAKVDNSFNSRHRARNAFKSFQKS